jgi:hypothetical protein
MYVPALQNGGVQKGVQKSCYAFSFDFDGSAFVLGKNNFGKEAQGC